MPIARFRTHMEGNIFAPFLLSHDKRVKTLKGTGISTHLALSKIEYLLILRSINSLFDRRSTAEEKLST